MATKRLNDHQLHRGFFEYAVGNVDGPGGESNVWVDGKFKGLDNLRFHGLFSRWYSAKAANNLRLVYEKQQDFEYDFVMLTRYDLAYNVDFDFSKFSTEISSPIIMNIEE